MSRKTLIFIGMFIGSVLGGYVPVLFGAELLSFSSLLGNTIGGLLGVYLVFKLTG